MRRLENRHYHRIYSSLNLSSQLVRILSCFEQICWVRRCSSYHLKYQHHANCRKMKTNSNLLPMIRRQQALGSHRMKQCNRYVHLGVQSLAEPRPLFFFRLSLASGDRILFFRLKSGQWQPDRPNLVVPPHLTVQPDPPLAGSRLPGQAFSGRSCRRHWDKGWVFLFIFLKIINLSVLGQKRATATL